MTAPLRFSALRQFAKSPAHYAAYLEQEQTATSGMDVGTAADILLLGGPRVVAYPGPVRRGKEFEAFKAANADALIVTAKEYETAFGIAASVQSCDLAMDLLTGIRQSTEFWTNNGRECRGTPDVRGADYIVDLKTGETSDPRRFHWKVRTYAYHAAAAWYLDGLHRVHFAATGQPARVIRAAFIIAVEQSPPHVVTVFKLTDHVLDMGERLWRTWFEQLQVCEASGEFPPYSQAIVDLDLPNDEDIELADAVETVAVSE
jgi:hypothetical protein